MSGPTKLLLQSQKMLASTVQFSTYDQTPVTRPRRTRIPPGDSGGTRTEALTRETAHPRFPGEVRSLRTQQRAYDRSTPGHHVPHPPRGPY